MSRPFREWQDTKTSRFAISQTIEGLRVLAIQKERHDRKRYPADPLHVRATLVAIWPQYALWVTHQEVVDHFRSKQQPGKPGPPSKERQFAACETVQT